MSSFHWKKVNHLDDLFQWLLLGCVLHLLLQTDFQTLAWAMSFPLVCVAVYLVFLQTLKHLGPETSPCQ